MEEADQSVVRVVSFVDVIPVPWRNGAGLTRAVAEGTEPPWRLSIASLSGVSAFSRFPDHDRTFLIASPGVVTIDVDGVRQGVGFGQSIAFLTAPVRLQGRATVVQVVVTASPLRPRTGAG